MTNTHATTPLAHSLLQRLPLLLLAALVFMAGWLFIASQQKLLWQRLPATAVERFVADQISTPLPRLPAASVLQAACTRSLSWKAGVRRTWLRNELAQCLASADGLPQGEAAQAAIQTYEALLDKQINAAEAWLAAYEQQAPQQRARLQAELLALQNEPKEQQTQAFPLQAVLQKMAAPFFPAAPTSQRENMDSTSTADRAANALREQAQAARAKITALGQGAMPEGERVRELALMAAGLQLVTDYGVAPPAAHLTSARNTLADALEWQRRASAYRERGFELAQLQALPAMLWASSLLLFCVVAFTSRGSLAALVVWSVASQLLGLGALMLTDLALTGEPALRYLAERQFTSFGLGDVWLKLTLALPLPGAFGGGVLMLWWPLLGLAACLLLLRALRDGKGWALAPVRAWVRGGAQPRWGAAQSALLLCSGTLLVLFLGMPAAISELLILLGCVGVASYLARQAPHANAGANLQAYNLAVVAGALLLAVAGSVLRGDLGHALVALLLAACFAWLFGWAWMRWAVLVGTAAAFAALLLCLVAGELTGPLAWLAKMLPPHAQDRFHAMFDPMHAGSSDMARIRWLMDSAGLSGWGMGYAPWQGLAAQRVQDGLPLQGPSDYVLALASTLWGQAGGLAVMALVLLVFVMAAFTGLRTALRPAMPMAVRWLAALGGFGCVVMAAKVVLSVGGVTGVLPLTGLPVSLLGYGPVTHLAALMYLALAMGTAHVQGAPEQRGVNVQAHAAPTGAVRRRGLSLAIASVAGLAALLAMGYRHMRADDGALGQQHIALARLTLAQALTHAMVPAAAATKNEADTAEQPVACNELHNAVAAWNQRLGTLAKPVRVALAADAAGATGTAPGKSTVVTQALRLDLERLQTSMPTGSGRACRSLARTLGQMLDTDLPRLVGRQGHAQLVTAAATATPDRLSIFDKPRALGARPVDYSTANAWWGRPGCLWPASTLAGLPAQQAGQAALAQACLRPAAGTDTSGPLPAETLASQLLTDIWLQRNLAPQLYVAQRMHTGRAELNHHPITVGPVLGLTLSADLQQAAQAMADCATGRLHWADCTGVLPQDAAWRQRHYANPAAMRAGAMGIVLAEVDTGRIVALAGAVSDCTLEHLGRKAQPDAQGRLPALVGNSVCAQLPDQRSAWLAQQHPALWMLPPGSSLKPFSLVAGMDAGLIAAGEDAYWKGILAQSHERLPIQRTALAAGQRYLDVLAGVGYGAGSIEFLWGGAADEKTSPLYKTRWTSDAYAGTKDLRATSMTLAQAESIRQQKESGLNVDKLHGEVVTREFVAARRLADASVGGGDIRINALGLVDAWRALDLRARGQSQAAALHLLEQPGRTLPAKQLAWASQNAAARALGMTTGVTASAWKGTAQGSCRVVLGACPQEGLAGLSGKTGSSDFLIEEDSPFVKPGLQLPAKLFGGVFAAADGKRYAVAVMALRVREGNSRTLDLQSSAPAEAALTMMRHMGMQGMPAAR